MLNEYFREMGRPELRQISLVVLDVDVNPPYSEGRFAEESRWWTHKVQCETSMEEEDKESKGDEDNAPSCKNNAFDEYCLCTVLV